MIDPPFLQNKPENSDDSAEISTAVVVPERLVQGGAALVRTDSGVAFVEGALPNERVRIGPVHRDGGAPRAELLEICEPSPYRRIPECPLFGDCGGCDWQHLHYSEQLRWKREILAENFRRLGSVVIPADKISVISGEEYGYRSRVQVHAADSGGVGFRRRNSHDTLVVSHCPVATPAINGELAGLNAAGRPRLDIRGGERTVLVEDDHGVAVGGIHREATISIDGVTVRFDPAGFAQANRHLLPDLSRALRTAWTGGALVDLYAGAGLLTALTIAGAPPAAPDNRPAIICVEPDERNARFISENLSVLGFSDTVQVVKTTAERAITGEPLKTVDADTTTVLVDPPRGGLSKAVSRWLVGARGAARATDAAKAAKATDAAKAGGTTRRAGAATAERIIYVSCDAAALARDVGRLNAAYQVNSVTLLDFYPQTAHIEALVVLDRRRVPHS